jgi:hypothetical protein
VSVDNPCEGYTEISLLGYDYVNAPTDGTAATLLYRCFNGTDHFETTSATCEGASGYTNEGTQGYVLTSVPQTVLPESPFVWLLPMTAIALLSGYAILGRRRRRLA